MILCVQWNTDYGLVLQPLLLLPLGLGLRLGGFSPFLVLRALAGVVPPFSLVVSLVVVLHSSSYATSRHNVIVARSHMPTPSPSDCQFIYGRKFKFPMREWYFSCFQVKCSHRLPSFGPFDWREAFNWNRFCSARFVSQLFIIETVYFRYRYNDILFEQVLCGRVSFIGGEI